MGQRTSSWRLFLVLGAVALLQTSCVLSYLARSGYEQSKILNARRPIDDVLKDPKISDDTKTKLKIATEAIQFAENNLGFKKNKNYRTYVHLDRPYVSWIVSAAYKNRLEYDFFWYPLVGKMPYKGFFKESLALEEANSFNKDEYDTWVRGVTAYSTLGWFEDPILSTMLKGEPHDIVEVVLHESAHATIFIDSNADFNEQLATFLGQEATKRFFLNKEGAKSSSIKKMNLDLADQKLFADFLRAELDELRKFYAGFKSPPTEEERTQRFQLIQKKFESSVAPKMKTKSYDFFNRINLNNAVLLGLGTYLEDLNQFQTLLDKLGGDINKFLVVCKNLKKSKNPALSLANCLSSVKTSSSVIPDESFASLCL